MSSTICAIATAPGGALGVVRVSGPDAIATTERIFHPLQGKPLSARKAHTLTFGHILDKEGEIVDEVLVSLFRAPHSYTGEDSTEISCHGSQYILQRVVELLVAEGCEVARPGEFTQRAFLSGKIDLSQAEAVADVIAADSAAAHRLAINQMRGGVSSELRILRDRLVHIASLLELELDFADHEDLEFADRTELLSLAQHIAQRLDTLVRSFSAGNALKNGVPVAIVGDANAGKSTLLNRLLGEERAIVSDVRGTTRDVIEDTININGITFRLIDTAGIRHTEDSIERMGIERTFERIRQASIILWLIDSTDLNTQLRTLASQILPLCNGKRLLLLLNKADNHSACTVDDYREIAHDLLHGRHIQSEDFSDTYDLPFSDILPLSALTGEGLQTLKDALVSAAALPTSSQNDLLITNARHYAALHDTLSAILRVSEGLELGLSGDLVAQDLRECIHHLSDIIGEVTSDQVLHNIFKHFCIGK